MARLPRSVSNPISLAGAGLALVMFGSIILFAVMDLLQLVSSPYLGIFTYVLFPGIMILGLLLIPLGAWLERRRLRKRGGVQRKYFHIDLNNPSHRFAFMIFTAGTMLLIVLSAAGMYQAYNYSESVEFCGRVCHEVMRPEYIAYQHSPHARVLCAECHIGEGADWFVKAKISGAYQVYSVIFNKFSRPIETPISNLRPARETCEHCHWPQKFSASLEMSKTYHPLDTTATAPWTVTLKLKIGGGQSELGPTTGIHWHMNTANTIEYVAVDKKRQTIPWVKQIGMDGTVRIYKSTEQDTSDSTLAKGEYRRMDCIDCHNRPSHIYYPPFRTINDAMNLNRIPSSLANIRSISSVALTQKYRTEEEALRKIGEFVRGEYRSLSPAYAAERKEDIDHAVKTLQGIYRRNFFPEMNVSWREYPNNIGHMYNEGCFRCHDNKHVAADGRRLTNDCNICHDIIAQGPHYAVRSDIRGMEFVHPVDIGDSWKTDNCTTCHVGE